MTKVYTIKNARVAYPQLFNRPVVNGNEGKFGCKVLLDPNDADHAALIAEIREDIREMAEVKLDTRLATDKVALRNGDDLAKPWAEGYYVLSLNANDRPAPARVFGRDMKPIERDELGLFYSGCRANVRGSLWAQNNQYGKRINGNFEAIQWVGHDEKIVGGGLTDAEAAEGLDALPDDEAAFAGEQAVGF